MIQALHERWQRCSPRERVILLIGGGVVAVTLVFLVIVDPLLSNLEKLDRQITRRQKDIQELARVAQAYSGKRATLMKLEQRMPPSDAPFSLLAFMEEATTTAQIRDRIVGMQPQNPTIIHGYQETAVDLRLDSVQLTQVLALLVAIEQAPYEVQVRHLQVKPKFDNPTNLDATLRIVTYAKA